MRLDEILHCAPYYQKLVRKFEIGDTVKNKIGVLGKVVRKDNSCGYLYVRFLKFGDKPWSMRVEDCRKVEE